MEMENNALMLMDNHDSFEMDNPEGMDVDATENDSTVLLTPTTPFPSGDNNQLVDPRTQTKKRGRKKSIVWEHFTIETVGPGCTKACCKHCKKSFAYITGSKLAGTSHLKRHIALGICPVNRQNNTLLSPASETKGGSTGPPKKRPRASPIYASIPLDQDRCYHEMAKMIIMHDYPLHMVEHPGFAGFVKTLQPQFSMASFNTIHGDCVSMYLMEKQKLSDLIGEIPGRVNLTLDMWTSNQFVGYLFLTGHFIDNEWNLHRRLLNVLMVPSPDSDVAFNQSLAACLSDWHLERKLSTLTVDQSIVNEAAIGNLRGFLSARNPQVLNGQLVIGNCYARVLSSMAQDALAAVKGAVKKVRDSVKYVTTNDSHQDRFYELKAQLQISSAKNIFLDDRTNWNSTYLMLLASIELKEVFSHLESSDPDYKMAPSSEDWKQIEVLCMFLKLFYDAATILIGPVYPTANAFYHEVTKVQLELTNDSMSEDPVIRDLAKPLKEKFDKYWSDCFLVLAIAVVMDPRFKMKLIEFSFSKIYGEDAGMWIKMVDDGIHDLYLDYTSQQYSLLEAFVDHGNGGMSEADMSEQVNFSQGLGHEDQHHSSGGSEDMHTDMQLQDEQQPVDTHPQNGQQEEGLLPDGQPHDGHSLVGHQNPDPLPQEGQVGDYQTQDGELTESLPQDASRAAALPHEAPPTETLRQEIPPTQVMPYESLSAEALPQETSPGEGMPHEASDVVAQLQEAPTAEAPVETPTAEAPVEAPTAEAPVETATAEAPVETATAEAPVETPIAEASVETATAGAPVEAPTAEAALHDKSPAEPPLEESPQAELQEENVAQEGQQEDDVTQKADELVQESRPMEEELPQETQQVEDGLPEGTQPDDGLVQESQPMDEPPHESQPMDETPIESHPMDEPPQESQPRSEPPQESQPMDEPPQESQSMEGVQIQDTQQDNRLAEESQPMEELAEETQPMDEIPHENQAKEELSQESQNEEGQVTQETQPIDDIPQETQPIEELLEETQPVDELPQETQSVNEPPQEAHSGEQLPEKSQPKVEIAQEMRSPVALPQEGQSNEVLVEVEVRSAEVLQAAKSEQVLHKEEAPSNDLHHETHTYELPQEGEHHGDVLLQEGHHLEAASSHEFPLITIGDSFSDFELYISEISNHQQMKSELDQYLEESLMPRSQDFDVLGWWKLNRTKYPTLSKMAADMLSVPFSTVTADSVFDTRMKKMDNYRSSLHPVTLEALLCAKDWFQRGSLASSASGIRGENMKMES